MLGHKMTSTFQLWPGEAIFPNDGY